MADVIFPAWLPRQGSNEQLRCSSAEKKLETRLRYVVSVVHLSVTGWVGRGNRERQVFKLLLEPVYLVNKNAQCRQSIPFLNKSGRLFWLELGILFILFLNNHSNQLYKLQTPHSFCNRYLPFHFVKFGASSLRSAKTDIPAVPKPLSILLPL